MNNMILNVNFNFSNIGINELVISLIGYLIVFTALVILFYVFNLIPKLLELQRRARLRQQGKAKEAETELNITGEINAAISTALFLYFEELHDDESNVITIKKISKRYSPWSSKIYGLRNFNRL